MSKCFAMLARRIGLPSSSVAMPMVALNFFPLASAVCARIPSFGKKMPLPFSESISSTAGQFSRMTVFSSSACGFSAILKKGRKGCPFYTFCCVHDVYTMPLFLGFVQADTEYLAVQVLTDL